MTFEKKWAYSGPFYQNKHLKRHFLKFYQSKKCSRATLRCSAGRMWPAGRTLPRPDIDFLFALFGSAHVKAAHRPLVKLTPGSPRYSLET